MDLLLAGPDQHASVLQIVCGDAFGYVADFALAHPGTALLDQAKTVEDTLEIYAALKQIRQEIEQLKGRIQYLEMTASMSLIDVELNSTTSLVAESWNIGEIWRSAGRGLTGFGQWLAGALIWILWFTPVWGGVTALVVWLVRRRKRNNAARQ